MTHTHIVGYPRIGRNRELKKLVESYFAAKIDAATLQSQAKLIEAERWDVQKAAGLSQVLVGDFSVYDTTLDTAFDLGLIPEAVRNSKLSDIEKYFALARGHQDQAYDIKALPMFKWFTSNYHYVVPQFEDSATKLRSGLGKLSPRILESANRAKAAGHSAVATIIGPLSLWSLSNCQDQEARAGLLELILAAYETLLSDLAAGGVEWVQFEEPVLVSDAGAAMGKTISSSYQRLLAVPGRAKLLLSTPFGDLTPTWDAVSALAVDGLNLDLAEGRINLDLVEKKVPAAARIYAGLVAGKNIWRSDYARALEDFARLKAALGQKELGISTACSLLHVPHTVVGEGRLDARLVEQLAFAEEKIKELVELSGIISGSADAQAALAANKSILARRSGLYDIDPPAKTWKAEELDESLFSRSEPVAARLAVQQAKLGLPALPTTTIGSLPQTGDVRRARLDLKKGELSQSDYERFITGKMKAGIALQEELGIDVLVHGEYERNDMVEYFAEHFTGFAFTSNAWVQSYGVRGVKPPIIFGHVSRRHPISVDWAKKASASSKLPVKGMLTGPITIFNWSFPGEHLGFKQTIYELGMALRDEIADLEQGGVDIIQVDEAALRERLPLAAGPERDEYLRTAVRGFRLSTSGVASQTQVHTHMCYSDFGSIFSSITDLDADVITIEAAKSDLSILETIRSEGYPGAIGPGVYDIHSPRIPSVEEIEKQIDAMLEFIPVERLWVNPDCGLKTRGESETKESLSNMVRAAQNVRKRRNL